MRNSKISPSESIRQVSIFERSGGQLESAIVYFRPLALVICMIFLDVEIDIAKSRFGTMSKITKLGLDL